MVRKKSLLVVLVLILLGGTLAGALNYTASNDESVTRILGYDVYKIEGSGNYIIYYPLPNGSVKILKKGKPGFLPTFVKVPRREWVKALSNDEKALYAPPTPLILYVTKNGKLGIKSMTTSKIKLDEENALDLKGNTSPKGNIGVQTTTSCPRGWMDFGGRYCLNPQWDLQFESTAKTKTFNEWISVMGLKVENNVAEKMNFDWILVLSRSTYSYWTVGIDVGPFTLLSVSRGAHFDGWGLDVDYQSFNDLPVNSASWERYLNIKVEYIVAHARVSAYDKLMGEYVDIDMAQVYPVKIHTTGKYTIWESATGGTYFTESQGENAPRITTTPNMWGISKEAEWRRKWLNAGSWEGAVYVRQSQSSAFSSSSSLSIPIGYAGGRYLAGINPALGRLANALSLTIGFHKYTNAFSFVEYSIQVKPRKDCYAMYSVLGVKVGSSGSKVNVPLVFSVITDGKSPSPPCDPRTGMCATSEGGIGG
ncbi:hypothetical protein A3L02_10035 [Thermococcus celer Vu 13 = JCM 8558]|uniref:Uncharacterized protein n=1 Tax=Thermococcus celer Vu 13 = JCM 8558 TaxID=1293037 RepID=A0A218P4P3_THECE|nr:hypothetical protein A3L02_10035 [Thermococcus celer Vu 13 = JCM 8558]